MDDRNMWLFKNFVEDRVLHVEITKNTCSSAAIEFFLKSKPDITKTLNIIHDKILSVSYEEEEDIKSNPEKHALIFSMYLRDIKMNFEWDPYKRRIGCNYSESKELRLQYVKLCESVLDNLSLYDYNRCWLDAYADILNSENINALRDEFINVRNSRRCSISYEVCCLLMSYMTDYKDIYTLSILNPVKTLFTKEERPCKFNDITCRVRIKTLPLASTCKDLEECAQEILYKELRKSGKYKFRKDLKFKKSSQTYTEEYVLEIPVSKCQYTNETLTVNIQAQNTNYVYQCPIPLQKEKCHSFRIQKVYPLTYKCDIPKWHKGSNSDFPHSIFRRGFHYEKVKNILKVPNMNECIRITTDSYNNFIELSKNIGENCPLSFKVGKHNPQAIGVFMQVKKFFMYELA